MATDEVLDWLLAGDPGIRWQALRDLTDAVEEDLVAERGRVAHEGWGAELLARQRQDGTWGGDSPGTIWRANLDTLETLRLLQPDPADPEVGRRIARTRDRVRWPEEFGAPAYFEGEVEACINGEVLAQGGFFGVPSTALRDRFVGEQLADGGWNCEAPPSTRGSVHSTIRVLEGLLAVERAIGPSADAVAAREQGEAYLLERGLLRRRSDGALIDEDVTRFGWPNRWRYDVLRALDHLRDAGRAPDPRLDEALELVVSRRRADGRWDLDVPSPQDRDEGLEPVGGPSRMITLRALRVLRHFGVDS